MADDISHSPAPVPHPCNHPIPRLGYEIPLYAILLAVLWGQLVLRVWSSRKNLRHNSVSSFAGLALLFLVAVAASVYYACLVASAVLLRRYYAAGNLPLPIPPYESDHPWPWELAARIDELKLAQRLSSRIGLWLAKMSFVALFFEIRHAFGKRSLAYLNTTTAAVAGTFVAVIVLDALQLGPANTFEYYTMPLHPLTELVASWLDIVTTILIILTPFSTITALNFRPRTLALLSSLANVVLVTAFLRLLMMDVTMAADGTNMGALRTGSEAYEGFRVLSDLEMFVVGIVAAFPGLRVVVAAVKKRDGYEPVPQDVPQDESSRQEEGEGGSG